MIGTLGFSSKFSPADSKNLSLQDIYQQLKTGDDEKQRILLNIPWQALPFDVWRIFFCKCKGEKLGWIPRIRSLAKT